MGGKEAITYANSEVNTFQKTYLCEYLWLFGITMTHTDSIVALLEYNGKCNYKKYHFINF